MKIYLVQHGKAVSKEENPQRPLSEQGRAEVSRVAEFLKKAGIRPPVIIHSGKLRAKETAEILALSLNPGAVPVEKKGISPLDDPSKIASEIQDLSDGTMIVGHLPHLGKFASLLVTDNPEKGVARFQQGGILCLEQDNEAKWAVAWLIVPQILPQ
ncbi:MAG: phosphohistidine phosphatase SixA [Deltaproteobacteria bacterium]|nr:MAG: phosphohistidine phosphatase SixA [Deltaproteobacteria bacterium]